MQNIERGSEEFQFWQDIFQFRKKFLGMKTDKEADEMFSEGEQLGNYKYVGTDIELMVRRITVDVMDDIDRRYTNERKIAKSL